MKILWFCNPPLSNQQKGESGTWLNTMADGLIASGNVELMVIALSNVKEVTQNDYDSVKQWLIPFNAPLHKNGLPKNSLVQSIISIVEGFAPDLVHVWGTEYYFGLLTARQLIKAPALLEIQGLKKEISKVFFGGLTTKEQLQCIGIKEVLLRQSWQTVRRSFTRWGISEEEIISLHQFIDAQSPWSESQIHAINVDATIFPVDIALRQPFYDCQPWQTGGENRIFISSAYSAPFKGIHVAIKALYFLRKNIPDVRLRIAGNHDRRTGIKQEGYMRMINKLIRKHDLESSIDWLGPLNDKQIVFEITNAAVTLIPSFVESYSVVMAEAMLVGTPVVSAFTGGTSYLGKDGETCLFFPPDDAAMCAYQLERIMTDQNLAQYISKAARKVAQKRHDLRKIISNQLSIYHEILKN